MITDNEYAVLAYNSYAPSLVNKVDVPGWTGGVPVVGTDGFAASVFSKGSDIVIAFRGTDAPTWKDFWYGNVPAARGTYSSQVAQAIQLVADTMAANPGKTISFTGHSLGGGLASLMAVFFDLKAVVFDAAPFGLTAEGKFIPVVPIAGIPVPIPVAVPSTVLRQYFEEYLARQAQLGRTADSKFTQFHTQSLLNNPALYTQRKANVTGRYLMGEVLTVARAYFPSIVGASGFTPVDIGVTTLNDDPLDLLSNAGVSLHSMRLLLAVIGGLGADTLIGGTGRDYLVGGAGHDTYQFSGAWDSDIIVDADHDGVVQVTGLGAITGVHLSRAESARGSSRALT
jgi:Ca2+-binding RTX toxin-like protein